MSRTPARPSRQRAAIVARSEHADLDPRVVIVDPTFAATLTTQHARSFVVVLGRAGVGADTFTRDLPNASDEALAHLDARGLATPGSRVEPGTILVGKVTPESDGPSSPEELLLRAIFGETASAARDTSLRAPPRCVGAVISASIEDDRAEVIVAWERPLEVGDVLIVDGERLAVAQIEPRTADIARAGGGDDVSIVKGAMARDALMARSIGPYEAPYDQPIRDPDGLAGQVVARATLAALATAAPWAAWEMLTIKADSPTGRARLYESLVKQERPDVRPQQPAPTAAAPVTPRSTDIFSFFEKEPGPGPGQLAPQQPEVVTMLALYLRALGLEVDLQTQAVGVKFLAPEQVREASHGELRGADDLASQRVFGPVRDYACACGKYQRMRHRGVVCEVCGVEVVTSRVRRTRCGHIELAAPCVHPLLSDAARRGRGRARDRPLVAGDAPMLTALVVLPPPLRGPAIDAAYARVLAADGDALQGAVDHLFAQLADAVDTTLHPRMYTKAVDYSGAAHLVVDPSLAPGQCRVPRSLLLELFRPQAYGLLEIHGYVTTIQAGKRMLEQQRPCALAMVAEASEGYPVLLAAGAAVVARRVSAWDAPAIGVDAATAALLAARVVALHVPVSYQAALTVAALGDLSRAPSTASDGWLARARRDGQFVDAALHAAVFGELDPIEDLVVHVALGRVPDPIDEGALGRWQSVEQARQRAIHDEYAERAAADPEPVPDLLGRCVDELELSRARPT